MFVVDVTTVVLESVGDDKVGDMHDNVIARNLVERVLAELDGRSLIFHYHAWPGVEVVEYGVATSGCAVQGEGNLILQLSLRIPLVLNKVMHEMLAHPFLGCEADVAAAQGVKHGGMAIVF